MSTQSGSAQLAPATLGDARALLRRRWLVVVATTLVGAALGLLAQQSLPEAVPTATVGLEIRPTGLDLSRTSVRGATDFDIDRALVQLTSQAVLEAAETQFGSPLPPAELREATDVRQLNDAPLLRLTVEAATVVEAVTAADALAEAYLATAAAEAVATRDAQDDQLRTELDETYVEIGRLGVQIGSTDDPSRVAALEGQRDAARDRARVLEEARADLRTHNVVPGAIAEPATADPLERSLGAVVALPGGIAVGFVLGLALAMLIDRLDRRLWTADDVARATGTGNVVAIGRTDLTGDGLRTGGGHRRLRALVAPKAGPTTVLVTGADADHGAGVAAGLAVAVAGAGRRVVLLDVSDRDAFGLPSGDVDGWLRGRVGLQQAARSPEGVTNLQVLRGSPSIELVASESLQQLLDAHTAVVVLHVPGGSDSGDAIGLAPAVDHVVVVAAARSDRGEDVARSVRWLGRDSDHGPVVVLAG